MLSNDYLTMNSAKRKFAIGKSWEWAHVRGRCSCAVMCGLCSGLEILHFGARGCTLVHIGAQRCKSGGVLCVCERCGIDGTDRTCGDPGELTDVNEFYFSLVCGFVF